MTAFTTWFETQIAQYAFDGTAFPSPPSTLYVALHTSDPGENADQNEISAADYNRQEAAHLNWDLSGTGPTTAILTERLEWPEAATAWGTVTHVSLWSGATSGANPFFFGQPADERAINEGDVYEIPANETIVRID